MLVELSPGQVFAEDFRIQRRLSAGGMGAVYVVEQLSTGILRALKLMHPELVQDPRLKARFVQEARIGGQIASDHVVQVISAGIDGATQTPWLAMELLDGQALSDWAQDRQPSPSDAREILFQVGHALGAAHALGIVHRDLKPENVFVARPKRDGIPFTVKILDFGIAKVAREGSAGLTQAIGTPLWMAPEQTQASSRIEPCTDVWALGLLAFWLVTGRHYWLSAGQESTMVLVREILTEPLVPASARASALGVGLRLPLEFDSWFARSVTRDQARRFRSAAEACAALPGVFDALGHLAAVGEADTAWGRARSTASPTPTRTDFARTERAAAGTVADPQLAPTQPLGLPLAPARKSLRLPLALVAFVATLGFGALALNRAPPSAPARCPDGMPAEPDGDCPICPAFSHRAPGSGCVLEPCPTGLQRASAGCVCPNGEPPGHAGCSPVPIEADRAQQPPLTASVSAGTTPHADAPSPPKHVPEPPVAGDATTPAVAAGPAEPSQAKPLDRSEALAALAQGERNATVACPASNPARRVGTVTVEFAPTGAVASAVVTGKLAGTRDASCVESTFGALRVAPFTGPGVAFKKAILLR